MRQTDGATMAARHRPSDAPESPRGASVLGRMLADPAEARRTGSLGEAVVAAWADNTGTLADGRTARLAASCLLRPSHGDRVLVWSGDDGQRWVLNVLDRADAKSALLSISGAATIKADRVALAADAVHIQAEDFLTSTRNRHAVEDVRTETVNTRVAQIGTDIRRASHATDQVEGTILQRAGTGSPTP